VNDVVALGYGNDNRRCPPPPPRIARIGDEEKDGRADQREGVEQVDEASHAPFLGRPTSERRIVVEEAAEA
jgi:hypothetical protein